MKHRFSIEVTTGAITRSIEDKDLDPSINNIITAHDIMECEVGFTAKGVDITDVVLPDGAQLLLGVRVSPSEGALLAQSTPHTMVGGLANCSLSLHTTAIAALVDSLPSSARSTNVFFEVEVIGAGETRRDTLAQQRFVLRCEVNIDDDDDPALVPGGSGLFRNPVSFPADSSVAGGAGDYSVNGFEFAVYVPGVGFRFGTLFAK